MGNEDFESVYTSATDGLRLHARDYGDRASERLPVVCLPGLTRNAVDFHDLALALSRHKHRPRRVLALDFRGRGLSAHDPDWTNYDVRVECADVLSQLTALGIEEAVFVGTSRGGLVSMALGAARPAALRGVVMNDIGPVIEAEGLIRIRSYVGKLPTPRTLDEAVELMRRIADARFPALSDDDWRVMTSGTWREEKGRLALTYDPALMKGLAALDLEAPLPNLWPFFAALKHVPVLVVRGEHSDLLSEATVSAMQAAHPACERFTAVGQGHAPLLRDAASINRIAAFVAHVEDGRVGASTPDRAAVE